MHSHGDPNWAVHLKPNANLAEAISRSDQLGPLEVIEPTKPVKLKDQALLQRWQDVAFRIQDKLNAALDNSRANDVKAYSIAAGVATDKLLILAGRPTSIVAGLHEIRHSLPQLAATLSRVATRISEPIDMATDRDAQIAKELL